ncbi:conserved hypothetical protein [Bosea sp. 62]|nr:conserved hypothetical protein [Bosea sp. 21B]CAD5290943.1 conserved hypothetical protein [Bosea sp. 46]CAD5300804.1 conserved hypothetical protein [Bosea sp. 7B]VVT60330.1 conserved hypothetical protein [Bosea sp. EC-HK365B]VXA96097.1 conserved hypothetical protein [Bosea sp. 62]VXB57194.1 conserved hypothetical protein [Bosea sp. 127]VXC65468.1 conserved hypothetical protein [Bosea sp. 29B]VXC96302.1 conserved hypothetical protein [Bosea sp. 125]
MMAADQNVRRSGIFVVVPTTDQPIILKKLAWSARVPVSRVVLATESSEVCEPWSTQYSNLLRPGEPLRQILGLPEGGSYRLAASGSIDQGKSWMVPTLAAHCALTHGEAVTHKASEAKLVIWGTGAIDLSVADTAGEARVTQQEYHLTTKIDRCRHLFADAEHGATPVLALVPRGEEAERAVAILGKILGGQPHHIVVVSSLADIAAPIDLFLRSGAFEPQAVASAPERPAAPGSSSMALRPFESRSAEQPAQTAAAQPEHTLVQPRPAGDEPSIADVLKSPQASRSRRQVLGDKPASTSSSSRLPLIAAAGLVLVAGAAGAGWYLTRGTATEDPYQAPPTLTLSGPGPTTTQPSAGTQQGKPAPSLEQQGATPQSGAAVASGSGLARLVLLSAPAGSSCEAQVYEVRPRYSEASVDVGEAPNVLIDGQDICGMALDPVASAKVKFQGGTGPAVVASKSTPTRLVFNPTATRGGIAAFPVIQFEEPRALSVEIKRR